MNTIDHGDSVFSYSMACCVGIALSLYALWVEVHKHRDPKYVAVCDLGDNMKCSRVLTSKYSKGFGMVQYLLGEEHVLNLPNCVTGLVFYTLHFILVHIGTWWATQLMFGTSILACIGSAYLAYILSFVLRDLCIVCVSTYFVNFYLLYASYQRFQHT